jgi:hypothetical protein
LLEQPIDLPGQFFFSFVFKFHPPSSSPPDDSTTT